MRVTLREFGELRRQGGGERIGVDRMRDRDDFGDPGNLRGLGGHGGRIGGKDGQMDLGARDAAGAMYALGDDGVQFAAGMFGDDQNLAHVCIRSLGGDPCEFKRGPCHAAR